MLLAEACDRISVTSMTWFTKRALYQRAVMEGAEQTTRAAAIKGNYLQ
jgi:hypothetical protein